MKKVVIIGRPNVGKSSFVNRLIGKRIAITAREEGVTRDIRYYDQTWNSRSFTICDTGGVVLSKQKENPYQDQINHQVKLELEHAHKIIFMVDFKHPDHPEDKNILHYLKPYLSKVALIINKVDDFEKTMEISDFYQYGIDQMFPISALQGNGIGDLLDYVVDDMPLGDSINEEPPLPINVALIGKPNVGKSSLFNAIFNQDKALVDEKMGTTRDINESIIKINNVSINFMDTAGIRRRRKITDTIEYFSIVRTDKAIESADVVVFMLDASQLLTDQDKKILNFIFQQHKNCIIYVNKWDLLERNEHTRNDIIRIFESDIPEISFYPIIMGSAKIKHHIQSLLETITTVFQASKKRIPTAQLNQFIDRFFKVNRPPSKKGKMFKIYYSTQVETAPPKLIFKVNDHNLLTKPFLRYFERSFREFFENSTGVGVSFEFRSKQMFKK